MGKKPPLQWFIMRNYPLVTYSLFMRMMAWAYLQRIRELLFKQGFSTGGSTGFGLFLSMKMIEVYGWTMAEKGEAGKGAKFVMTIPKVSVSVYEKEESIKIECMNLEAFDKAQFSTKILS